jgi:hypothetical protein
MVSALKKQFSTVNLRMLILKPKCSQHEVFLYVCSCCHINVQVNIHLHVLVLLSAGFSDGVRPCSCQCQYPCLCPYPCLFPCSNVNDIVAKQGNVDVNVLDRNATRVLRCLSTVISKSKQRR